MLHRKIYPCILTFAVIFITQYGYSQAPEGINYQAVLRKSNGQLWSNYALTSKIEINQGNFSGPTVYAESHNSTSNNQGIVNYVIGNGTVLAGNFESIDWGLGPYYLKLSVNFNNGDGMQVYGIQQLVSVPYALHAKVADSIAGGVGGSGGGTDDQNLTGANLNGTELQIDIEDGNPAIVDLSPLQDGTGTDDQNLTGANLNGTELQIDIEDGNSTTVDLASLQDGTGTDDQNLTGATLNGTELQIDIEDGNSTIVDLAPLQDGTGTDDQNLTGANLNGTELQIDIEDGNSTTVDLAPLKDHDWYEGSTTNQSDDINDNIYTEGQVGIGTNLYGGKLKIDMDGNSTNIQTIEFSLPGSPTGSGTTTGMVFNSGSNGDYSRFNLYNQPSIDINNRFFGLNYQGEQALYIRKGGNVGVGTATPDRKLVTFDFNGDVSTVTTLLSLQKSLFDPSSISSGVGVGIEFKSAANGEDPNIRRGIGEINAIFKDASGGSNSIRNGFFKFETYHHGYKYNRMELLGSGIGMANGSTTLHYSSPILRLVYDTYMSSNSIIASGYDLGALEFYGKMGSNSGVGAKIVAATSAQWGGSVNDYPSELQFYTASDGTASGLLQRMVITKDGSVGIGEVNPVKPIHLSGNDPDFRQNIASTSTANLLEHEFSVDNTVKSSLYYSKADDGFYLRNKTNGTLHLGTDNSNDLSIETGGDVTVSKLAGTGTRMVTSDANGKLASQSIPVNTDNQTLSLSSNQLTISGGNTVNLNSLQDGDNQTLTYGNGSLSITGGNSVNISGVNTDNQTLNFNSSTNTLTISGSSSSVDLSSLATGDNLGNHSANVNLKLNGNYISNDGGNEGVRVENDGDVTVTGKIGYNNEYSSTAYTYTTVNTKRSYIGSIGSTTSAWEDDYIRLRFWHAEDNSGISQYLIPGLVLKDVSLIDDWMVVLLGGSGGQGFGGTDIGEFSKINFDAGDVNATTKWLLDGYAGVGTDSQLWIEDANWGEGSRIFMVYKKNQTTPTKQSPIYKITYIASGDIETNEIHIITTVEATYHDVDPNN